MTGKLLTPREFLDSIIERLKNCGYKTAVHEVHQKFGPEHPVTKKIQEMHKELTTHRKHLDYEDRKYIGRIKRAMNEKNNYGETFSDAEGSQSR